MGLLVIKRDIDIQIRFNFDNKTGLQGETLPLIIFPVLMNQNVRYMLNSQ